MSQRSDLQILRQMAFLPDKNRTKEQEAKGQQLLRQAVGEEQYNAMSAQQRSAALQHFAVQPAQGRSAATRHGREALQVLRALRTGTHEYHSVERVDGFVDRNHQYNNRHLNVSGLNTNNEIVLSDANSDSEVRVNERNRSRQLGRRAIINQTVEHVPVGDAYSAGAYEDSKDIRLTNRRGRPVNQRARLYDRATNGAINPQYNPSTGSWDASGIRTGQTTWQPTDPNTGRPKGPEVKWNTREPLQILSRMAREGLRLTPGRLARGTGGPLDAIMTGAAIGQWMRDNLAINRQSSGRGGGRRALND